MTGRERFAQESQGGKLASRGEVRFSEIKRIVAEILEIDITRIGPDAHLIDDLGMDSMKALEVLAGVERRFRLKIPEDKLRSMTTVSKIADIVNRYAK